MPKVNTIAETDETLATIRALYQALLDHDREGVQALLDPNALLILPATGEVYEGDEAVAGYLCAVVEPFADLRFEILNLFAQGEQGVVEAIRIGTHTRPLRLLNHSFGPTGRAVRLSECILFRVQERKVAELSVHVDRMAEMEQLGLPGLPLRA